MKGIQSLARLLAIGMVVTTPVLAATWSARDAYAASSNRKADRPKALADCNHQASQQKIAAKSIRRKNYVRECLRERGFSGPP
jgi:hypothetical protein